jgi:hypothetical protein
VVGADELISSQMALAKLQLLLFVFWDRVLLSSPG